MKQKQGEVEQEEEVPEKQEDDYLLESCVFVSEDKMQASINFSLASDVLKEELLKMDVSDVLKLLKHPRMSSRGFYGSQLLRC